MAASRSALRRLFLAALLWLPAMFFVWVYFSSVLVLPATLASQAVLKSQYGGLFADVYRGFPRHLIDGGRESLPALPGTPMEGRTARDDHLLVLRFNEAAMPPAMRADKRASGEEPLPMINTLIFGYGLALVWGLVLATPLTSGRRLSYTVDTLAAYRSWTRRRGLEATALRVSDVSVGAGERAARKVLRRSDPPDAFYATTDDLAFGVMLAEQSLGLSIPAEVGLVAVTVTPGRGSPPDVTLPNNVAV